MVSCTPFTPDADQLMSIEGCLTIKGDPPQNKTPLNYVERGKQNGEKLVYKTEFICQKKRRSFLVATLKHIQNKQAETRFAVRDCPKNHRLQPWFRACSAFTSSPKPSSELAKLPNNLASCSKISLGGFPVAGKLLKVLLLHPWKLTCPPKRDYFSREYIFQPLIFRGHVSFQGSRPG